MLEKISASELHQNLLRGRYTLLNKVPGKSRPHWEVLCNACHSRVSFRADVLAGSDQPSCPSCRKAAASDAQAQALANSRKDYSGSLLSDNRFLVRGEAGRDKHGYVLWEVACTACNHVRNLRKKDLPNSGSYCRKCCAKSPSPRKPKPGAVGRFTDELDSIAKGPAFLWWVVNLRPDHSFPEAWSSDFDEFFWECNRNLEQTPALMPHNGLETVRMVRVDPNLPWSWGNARIAPVRGRANPRNFGRFGPPPPEVTKDGLLIHHTAQWGEPLTHHYPLPDDQWVDPEPTRDLTPEQAQNLIENSDRF